MKTFYLFFLMIFCCCSCRLLQPAIHSDETRSKPQTSTDSRFLDDVSITPGGKKSSSINSSGTSIKQKNYYETKTGSSFNIEAAKPLQFKYAVLMDVPVEDLNNISLLLQIDHWWGTRYCLGGSTENCIDCSAFTQTMLASVFGITVPRTANEQYNFSTHISDADLKQGDLVFFKSGRNITHVGMYLANGKFVHASVSSGVTISSLNDSYWSNKYAGAGRVLN